MPIYNVVSVSEKKGDIGVEIHVTGTRTMIRKPLTELRAPEFLHEFSVEDAIYLQTLFIAQEKGDCEIIHTYPRPKAKFTANALFLGMLFVALWIASLVMSFKLTAYSIFGFTQPFAAGLVLVPIHYFLCDLVTEVYGFRVSRVMIWAAMACIFCGVAAIQWAVRMPCAQLFTDQSAFATVLGFNLKFFIAGMIGFLTGEFSSAALISRIKMLTNGRHLWFRMLVSTLIGTVVNATLFPVIAFWGRLDTSVIGSIVGFEIVSRMFVAVLLLPVFYGCAAYLKQRDAVDAYDYGCSLNPFSLRVD